MACRIQAAVRGWLARRHYWHLVRHFPPQHAGLRKRWAAARLGEETDKAIRHMQSDVEDLDTFFAELDASVAHSRTVGEGLLKLGQASTMSIQVS